MAKGDDDNPFSSFETLEKGLEEKFKDSKNILVTPSHADTEYSKKRDRQVAKRKSKLLDVFLERYRAGTEEVIARTNNQNSTTHLRTVYFWTVTVFLMSCVTAVLAAIAYDSFALEISRLNPTLIGTIFSVLIAGLIGIIHLVGKGLFSTK